jgi:long-chain acyl-CoA synthetase
MSGLPGLLRERARERPRGVALRRKALGIWEETTWEELDRRVARLALGLAGAGVSAGDAVALVGDNSPDWIAADLALQALGARCVTPWPTLTAEALAEDLRRTGAGLVVCGDEEQLDKVSALRTIVIDPTGVDADETTLAAIAEAGAAEPLERYEALLAQRSDADEVCVAFDPVSGAAVAFTAGGLVAVARAVAEGLSPGDRTLCVLPLASLPARVLDVYAPLAAGAIVHVPESPASVPTDLAEVAPTALTVSPRALELLRSSVQVRAARSRRFKRRVQGWARERRSGVAKLVVARPAARLLGFGATRRVTCVGGPLTDAMVAFVEGLGSKVEVIEGLALLGGRPLPGVDARVEDGRLVTSAPWSGRVIDGALEPLLARLDGERIVVIGTPVDVVGEAVLPELEARLRDSPYITEAALVPGAEGLVAHVGLDADATGLWAARHGVHAATPRALAAHAAVRELAQAEVARLAGDVASVVVLPRRLSEADGELTPLLSVRREGVRA